jgi:hypothetical protein
MVFVFGIHGRHSFMGYHGMGHGMARNGMEGNEVYDRLLSG